MLTVEFPQEGLSHNLKMIDGEDPRRSARPSWPDWTT